MINAKQSCQAKNTAGENIPKRQNVFEMIYNQLASLITPLFLRTCCTPNYVTILSGVFGVIGAVLLVFQSRLMLILAAVCIQAFAVLDLVDGNIARAKNMRSKFGQWLDIFFDKLNDFLLIVGLTTGTYRAIGSEHILLLGMCLMGFVFFIQFVMVVDDTLLKIEEKVASDLHRKTQGHTGSAQRCRLVKRVAQITIHHCTLGHSAFLFLISVFACLNASYFGLWFLTVHACVTLILIVAGTFYRLQRYEEK